MVLNDYHAVWFKYFMSVHIQYHHLGGVIALRSNFADTTSKEISMDAPFNKYFPMITHERHNYQRVPKAPGRCENREFDW